MVPGPEDLGWPPAHHYLGSATGAAVNVPHDPSQHKVGDVGNHVFDVGHSRSGSTS